MPAPHASTVFMCAPHDTGSIFFEYLGRAILIKVKPPGISIQQISQEQMKPEFKTFQRQLQSIASRNTIIFSKDILSENQLIETKLKLIRRYVESKRIQNLRFFQVCVINHRNK